MLLQWKLIMSNNKRSRTQEILFFLEILAQRDEYSWFSKVTYELISIHDKIEEVL